MKTKSFETWFLLYDGSSMSDVFGPKYIGRTTDLQTAKQHYEKCFGNAYSSGYVHIVTDTKTERASPQTKWEKYEEKQNGR